MQGREFYAIPWCIWFLSLKHVLEISCHLYDFIKCFNVSLHLSLLCWNVTLRLERILVWRFMVLCCGNGSWYGCIARRIWNNHRWYSENWLVGSVYVMLQALSFDILFMSDRGWKSISPRGRHSDVGVWGWSYPWVWVPKDMGYDFSLGMSPKRHRVWLALGCCPKIIIIILIEYLMEHWYLIYRLVGVSSLLVVKGWTRKSKDETNKHMHTCLTWLHIY